MAEMTTYGRVSRVENFVYRLVKGAGLSSNVFVSTLPVTIKSEWADMVLIDVGKGDNLNAYRRFSVNVYLYAKGKGDLQTKNVNVIDAMEEKLLQAVSNSKDNNYTPTVNWSDSDYDSTRNLHFNVVNLTVKVHD
mgnify:FL=1